MATPAQIEANRKNAARSTGPTSEAGKNRSRENALKHGLSGDGTVVAAEDQAEVERLTREFDEEYRPQGPTGKILIRRMAVMKVRMDKCIAHESVQRAGRTFEAEAEFDAEWPAEEGVEDPFRDQARAEVADLVWFDPSREATLLRKYEAAAERCFLRSIKELRIQARAERAALAAPKAGQPAAQSGSFLSAGAIKAMVETLTPKTAPKPAAPAPKPSPKPVVDLDEVLATPTGGVSFVPIAIGRPT